MDRPDGEMVQGGDLGPLSRDLFYMSRTLQSLLRPEGQAVRAGLEIEPGVIGVLSIIWLNPGISQNDLARSLVLKKSAITALVTRLEARGLIARERTAEDRRINALTLTAAGHALIARIRARTEAVNDRLFDGIAPRDRERFFAVMAAVIANLDRGQG